MAAGAVTVALAGREMVDLAVATSRATIFSRAVVLGAALGGRARETPNVLALPGSAALVRAPRAATNARQFGVAPLTHPDLADPLREVASDPALFKW